MIDIKIHNRGLEFDIINYFDFLYIYKIKNQLINQYFNFKKDIKKKIEI